MDQALAASRTTALDALATDLLVFMAGIATSTPGGLLYTRGPQDACAVLRLPFTITPADAEEQAVLTASVRTLEDALARLQRAHLITPITAGPPSARAYLITIDEAEEVRRTDPLTTALSNERTARRGIDTNWRPEDWDRALQIVRAAMTPDPLQRELALHAMLTDPHGDGPLGVSATRNVLTVLTDVLLATFDVLDHADAESAAVHAFRQAMDAALAESPHPDQPTTPGGTS